MIYLVMMLVLLIIGRLIWGILRKTGFCILFVTFISLLIINEYIITIHDMVAMIILGIAMVLSIIAGLYNAYRFVTSLK